MSAQWIDEGVAVRTMFGHPNPVVHLVVGDRHELWCSGGPGRVAAIAAGTGLSGGRPCPKCAALARDAIAEGDLAPEDVPRFVP